MKTITRLNWLPFFLLFLMVRYSSWAYPVMIQGSIVSVQTGQPVPNHPVTVSVLQAGVPFPSMQFLSASNGIYNGTITIPGNDPAQVVISTLGLCNSNLSYSQTFQVSPVNSGLANVLANFEICTSNSNFSCEAAFSFEVDPNPPSLSFTNVYFFDNSFSNSADPIVSWSWTTDTGQSSSLEDPVFGFFSLVNIPHLVCLTITTASGCTSTFCDSVYLYSNPNCSAEFLYSQSPNSTNPLSFSFETLFPNQGMLYSWNFGDGTSSNQVNPSHSFSSPGTYLVCLAVLSSNGCADTMCAEVVVTGNGGNNLCQAAFEFFPDLTTLCFIGQAYAFFGTNTASGNVLSWSWEFSDGGFSSDQNPVHCFAYPGVYEVCLTIVAASSNGNTCTSTICQAINVGQNPGNCEASFSYSIFSSGSSTNGYAVVFTDGSFGGPNNWQWNFGDGSTGSGSVVEHFYQIPGNYPVCLVITSNSGCVDTVCQTIFVGPSPGCEADFEFVLDTLVNCINCFQFINQSIVATNAFLSEWDFGDGSTSSEYQPVHSYTIPGTYEVCLTIFAMDGCTDSFCQVLTVPGNSGIFPVWGYVTGSGNAVPGCAVLLMGSNGSIQTTLSGPLGGFEFPQVTQGNYLLYAIPPFSSLSTYMPTYFPSAIFWASAQQFAVPSVPGGGNPYMISLAMLDSSNIPGNGSIAGTIVWPNMASTDGFRNRLEHSVEGIIVALLNAQGNPIRVSESNVDGSFLFEDLPFGQYQVYVEMAGYTTYPLMLELSDTHPAIQQIQVLISGTSITATILNFNQVEMGIKVFPNPADKEIRVAFYGSNHLYSVSLFDLTGRKLLEVFPDGSEECVLPLDQVAPGMYSVLIESELGKLSSRFIRK